MMKDLHKNRFGERSVGSRNEKIIKQVVEIMTDGHELIMS